MPCKKGAATMLTLGEQYRLRAKQLAGREIEEMDFDLNLARPLKKLGGRK